jgi:hypothetical protein
MTAIVIAGLELSPPPAAVVESLDLLDPPHPVTASPRQATAATIPAVNRRFISPPLSHPTCGALMGLANRSSG